MSSVKNITKVRYSYRDLDNYKQQEFFYLAGSMSEGDWSFIKAKLYKGVGFIPADLKLKIEELQFRIKDFPTKKDHHFHELHLDQVERVPAAPIDYPCIRVGDFLKAFGRIRNWNEEAALKRLKLQVKQGAIAITPSIAQPNEHGLKAKVSIKNQHSLRKTKGNHVRV